MIIAQYFHPLVLKEFYFTSGCGGNAIHLAKACDLVIASDIDAQKINALRSFKSNVE